MILKHMESEEFLIEEEPDSNGPLLYVEVVMGGWVDGAGRRIISSKGGAPVQAVKPSTAMFLCGKLGLFMTAVLTSLNLLL
jgi:hypothetical protein